MTIIILLELALQCVQMANASTLENVHIITVFREALTSQNSPSSYSASSLNGSKNGRLTMIPKETNHTSFLTALGLLEW